MRRTRKPPAEPPSSDPSDGEVANTSRWRRALAPVTEELERASWVARWVVEAPSRWLGRRSTVGQDLTGTTDGLSYLRHLARGNRIRRQVSFENLDPDKPPVLLIHGFLGTRGSMYLLEHRLVEDGFVVVSFNIGTLNVRDIRRSAFMIHRKIERILAQTPFQKIDIVGHSMGALASRYFVKFLGGDRVVRNFVSITSANHGTVWGNPFSPVCVVRDQAIGSLFLTLLNADDETPGAGVRYAAIRGVTDIFVQPSDSGALDGAWNVTVGLDHVEVLLYPSSFELVQQALSGGGANLN